MKICRKCGGEFPLSEFREHRSNKDGLTGSCRTCINNYQNLRYSLTRKSKRVKKTKEEKIERYRVWQNNRKKIDPNFKLDRNIRNLIQNSFKYVNSKKSSRTVDILGCSVKEFKDYIESKFEYWMNWENHGKYNGNFDSGWDLDHIIPTSSAKTTEDIIKLNHYTNFQPLCSKMNRFNKRNKIQPVL